MEGGYRDCEGRILRKIHRMIQVEVVAVVCMHSCVLVF